MARWLRKSIGLIEAHNINRFVRSEAELSRAKALTVGHQDLDSLIRLKLLRPQPLEAAFSFVFVRNPFTRAVSLWKYLTRKGHYPSSRPFSEFIDDIVRENSKPGPYNLSGLSMASPMACWVEQERWHGPSVHYRMENLDDAINDLSARLNVENDFPRVNTSPPATDPLELSIDTTDKIRSFYRRDFELFGYSVDPPEEAFRVSTKH